MATETLLATIWHTPDELWSLIAPVLGPEKAPGTPGRPAVPYRRIFDGISHNLRQSRRLGNREPLKAVIVNLL